MDGRPAAAALGRLTRPFLLPSLAPVVVVMKPNVLTQAERYSKGATESPLNYRGYRVPFLYATNGQVIWFHDIRHQRNHSRKTRGFHTAKALRERLSHDFEAACERCETTANDHHWLRPYQREANEAIEHAISNRKRQILVAMATGTGKTFTLVNQVYRLMKSGQCLTYLNPSLRRPHPDSVHRFLSLLTALDCGRFCGWVDLVVAIFSVPSHPVFSLHDALGLRSSFSKLPV